MSNKIKYYLVGSLYLSAIMLSSGTVIQIFMTNAGISKQLIGVYSSLINIVSLTVNMLFAKFADEIKDVKRANTKSILLIAICCLGFLPPCFAQNPNQLLLLTRYVMIPVSILQTAFISIHSVLDYKLPYYIIDIKEYGSITAIYGIISYACSTVLSLILSYCIDHFDYVTTMLYAFAGSAVLVFLAALINQTYTMQDLPAISPRKTNAIKAIMELVKMKDFYIFIIPNFLRGISMGVISVLAVICLGLGYQNTTASVLVTVTNIAYFLGSSIYYILAKRMTAQKICLWGAVLLIPLSFTPAFNDTGFLILAFLTLVGKLLIDYAVPIRIYNMIPPEIACTYHAGRLLLTSMGTAFAMAISGFLIEGGFSILFIVIGILSQFISSLVYLLYKRKK